MASSQVEIASNTPFGYVLKDRNRHDRFRTRDSNSFQKNFQDLVQTHLNSCISGHSRNSDSGFIDQTDLWVHHPQTVKNQNDIHSQNSGDTRMSGQSDSDENSHPHIDYTDLWVHTPHMNDNENNLKKTKAGEKWDKARDMVFAYERKAQEALAGAVSASQKLRDRDGASSGPALISRKGKPPDNPSSGLVSTSQGGKVHDGTSLGPASTSQRGRIKEGASSGAVVTTKMERNPDGSSSGPVSTCQRGRIKEGASSGATKMERSPDDESSGPVSTSQKGRIKEGASSGAVVTTKMERSPDGSSSGPVSTSQRGRIKEEASSGNGVTPKMERSPDGLSSGPVSTSQSGRMQEGASSGAVVTSKRERSPDGSSSGPVSTSQRGRNWEVVSSRLLSLSQRRKSLEGMSSEHDLRYQRENSPEKSESSMETLSSCGVSSLVQRWRDFQAEGKSLSAIHSPATTSRSNSVSFYTDNESFADAPTRGSDACEACFDLRPATPTKNDELFLGWESDQTGLSGPPSTRGRDSDATESEKIRVADIIKKLTSNGEYHVDREPTVNHESLPRLRTSLDKSEQRSYSPVCNSPRVRGRQAYNDLLTQMERDRQNELERLGNSKTVSKFAHKGRIQAMLRVKLLRRGVDEKDGRHTISKSSESSRLAQSAIVHRRQRFNEGVQHNETDSINQQGEEMVVDKAPQGKKVSVICQQTKENHQQGLTETTKPLNALDNNLDAEKTTRADPVVDVNHGETNTMVLQNGIPEQGSEIFHQETDSSSDVTQQGKIPESRNQNKPEIIVKETAVKNNQRDGHLELEESKKNQHTGSSNEFMNVIAKAQADDMEEEEDTNQNLVDSDCGQESDVSPHPQDCYEQQLQSNQDWIIDVSRPRSTWEDLRQARYQEMLDPFIENHDIRQLLHRKSVSTFLTSGLRESIDRLMMSRTQQPPNPFVSRIKIEERTDQVEEGDEAQKVEMEEEQKEPEGEKEEEEEKESEGHSGDCEKDEEHEIQSQQESTESRDYGAQATSWDVNQDHGVSGNYFHPVLFLSPQEYQTFNSSASETQPSSLYRNHPSIETDFVYEMRGNMERLYQEVAELKRSVESCISMQMKLKKSMSQEGLSASFHSGRKKRRDSTLGKKSSKGRRCYICYEMQIDTLLYRCGHMCTCFKCAQDLQWSSGKCPICEAPIIDVVRTYACS